MSNSSAHDPLRPGTLEEAKAQALNREEFEKIKEILGRTPNVTELAIFAVMWSEHCSYKNSILQLKTLPRSGGKMMADAGAENAGLIDIGDNWAVAFKIESHNHPSAVEPFQGAATGVGGILRDIFTMGARPLASLDSLHFGELNIARNRFLLDGVVRGIAHYGNCFGVPTIAGDVCFDNSYSGNPLINVMAVGVVKHDCIATARASGVGNPVFYVGSRTGRDGTHGATFASEELSADNESKRSAVQVGDPFAEKLLLEATLELTGTEALVAIQDMGAAGLTCSSSEMSAAGGVGMELNLDLVPLREDELDPWEIMLSESQERMLLIAKAGEEEKIIQVFEKWDLEAVEIGKITDDGNLRLFSKGAKVAEVPVWNLVLGGGAPQYIRETKRPDDMDSLEAFDPLSCPQPEDLRKTLLELLSFPEISSKEWIFEQFDQSVRTNTVTEPGKGDAAVVRVEGSRRGFAVKTDGNGRYITINPRAGAERIVFEAARNVACTGALPTAITNCLNFGNPYKPEVYYYFSEVVAGMGSACRALNTPVTGGNVSFHNETSGAPVMPTLSIGMLGVFEDVSKNTKSAFQKEGDFIYLLGSGSGDGLGGSAYLKAIHGKTAGQIDKPDAKSELQLIGLLVVANNLQLLSSAHDVSDGGLAVTLAECCVMEKRKMLGAIINLPVENNPVSFLFGESPGRVVISLSPENAHEFENTASKAGVLCKKIGIVGGDSLDWKSCYKLSVDEISQAYYNTLRGKME